MENRLNILIIENEPLIKIFLKRVVRSLGHHIVSTPSDAKTALEDIKKHSIDLMFVDINIDGAMDGISLVKKLKFQKKSPIIYFISAYNDKETIHEALLTDARNYLVKPIKEEDIFIALNLALKEKQPQHNQQHITLSDTLYYAKDKKELFEKDVMIKLTKIEKKMIDLFIKNININVPSEVFIQEVWEGKEVSTSTMRTALFSLRKKLPSLQIETNFGRGYMLYVGEMHE